MNWKAVLALLLVPLMLVGVGRWAQQQMEESWMSFAAYRTPYAFDLPGGRSTEPLTDRVVLVVIDGLRVDRAEEMPVLRRLMEEGAYRIAVTGEPSVSYPSWTVVVTGAYQEITGVTSNWYEGQVKVDNVFAAAQRAGLRTVLVGSPGWEMLFGAWFDERYLYDKEQFEDPDLEVSRKAVELARAGELGNLNLVYFGAIDDVGHAFGAASEEYAQAADRVDGLISDLVEVLDPSTTTLVITSDHGHIDTGGHGGWEPVVKEVPLILWGRGVQAGSDGGKVGQADIAPTIAALLGAPHPSHSTGRVLVEMLNLSEDQRASRMAAVAEVQAAFTRKYVAFHRGEEPQLEVREEDPVELLEQAAALRESSKTAHLAAGRWARVPSAVAFLLLILALAYLALRHPARVRTLVGTATYFVLYNLLFFGRGYRYSLSVINEEAYLMDFFNSRLIDAAACLLLAAAVTALLVAWRRRYTAGELVWNVETMSLGVFSLLALQVLWMYYTWGFSYEWYLPDLGPAFKFYLDMLQMVATGFAAVIAPLVGLLVGKIVTALVPPGRAVRG